MTEWEVRKAALADELVRRVYEAGVIRTWLRDQPEGWELVSGRWSPFYVMMRNAPSDPELFRFMVDASAELITHEMPEANVVVGIAATGIPIAAALGYRLGMRMGFTRKMPNVRSLEALEQEVHRYGGHSLVEGLFRPGDRIVMLDDVVSHFDSKEIALRQLELELARREVEDVTIEGVAVLIDRGNEAEQRAAAYGVRLASLAVLLEGQLEALRGVASDREIEVIGAYLRDPDAFQASDVREALVLEVSTELHPA